MRYALSIPPFGDLGEARAVADLAREAEEAGWDGFFIWDHILFDPTFHPMLDPWVALAAVALQTSRIRIGTMITPLPRRRPWKLARETVSVDRLSGGRLILGVGIGDPAQWDYGFFGEPVEAKVRARMLDEGLDILTGLWSGERFSYQGAHYQMQDVVFRPRPAQAPRIPIWVGGWWPNKPPLRRAARWDGVFPGKWGGTLTPDEVRAIVAYIMEHRTSAGPFDVVVSGQTPGANAANGRDVVVPLAEAGATWWVEDITPWRFGWQWEDDWSPDATRLMQERVRQGPPRR